MTSLQKKLACSISVAFIGVARVRGWARKITKLKLPSPSQPCNARLGAVMAGTTNYRRSLRAKPWANGVDSGVECIILFLTVVRMLCRLLFVQYTCVFSTLWNYFFNCTTNVTSYFMQLIMKTNACTLSHACIVEGLLWCYYCGVTIIVVLLLCYS